MNRKPSLTRLGPLLSIHDASRSLRRNYPQGDSTGFFPRLSVNPRSRPRLKSSPNLTDQYSQADPHVDASQLPLEENPNSGAGTPSSPGSPLSRSEISPIEAAYRTRLTAYANVSEKRRSELGQYFTPPHIARLMAAKFQPTTEAVRLLDCGAGLGVLTAAFVQEALQWRLAPKAIDVVLFEIESSFVPFLEDTLLACARACELRGVPFTWRIDSRDFIEAVVTTIAADKPCSTDALGSFTHCILNPPYSKLGSDSRQGLRLRELGVKTSNLYAAFIWLAVRLLGKEGEFCSLSPRSFCNGPHFAQFRDMLSRETAIEDIHTFDSRYAAFREDNVCQELIVLHARRSHRPPLEFNLTSNTGDPEDDVLNWRKLPYHRLFSLNDSHPVVQLPMSLQDEVIMEELERLPCSLDDLGLAVSTGAVLEHRVKDALLSEFAEGAAPMIYSHHLRNGRVVWPGERGRRPSAIFRTQEIERLLIPSGCYVLVKRFSAREQRRRVMAFVLDSSKTAIPATVVGINNQLNYFHRCGKSLDPKLAAGMAMFLNSTITDRVFRIFNGTTQVNAADLRRLRYPSPETLRRIGSQLGTGIPSQTSMDRIVNDSLDLRFATRGALAAQALIDHARFVLGAIGISKDSSNERCALALLACLGVIPGNPWTIARPSRLTIETIIEFCSKHFGRSYHAASKRSLQSQLIDPLTEKGVLQELSTSTSHAGGARAWICRAPERLITLLRLYGSRDYDTDQEIR